MTHPPGTRGAAAAISLALAAVSSSAGATTATLTLDKVQKDEAGKYAVPV